MRFVAILCGVFASIALIIAILFALGILNLERQKFFEPRKAEIQRQIFENTPSYVHGKINHLTQLQAEYILAKTDTQRSGLRTIIIREAATVDNNLLPFDLQSFIKSIR